MFKQFYWEIRLPNRMRNVHKDTFRLLSLLCTLNTSISICIDERKFIFLVLSPSRLPCRFRAIKAHITYKPYHSDDHNFIAVRSSEVSCLLFSPLSLYSNNKEIKLCEILKSFPFQCPGLGLSLEMSYCSQRHLPASCYPYPKESLTIIFISLI